MEKMIEKLQYKRHWTEIQIRIKITYHQILTILKVLNKSLQNLQFIERWQKQQDKVSSIDNIGDDRQKIVDDQELPVNRRNYDKKEQPQQDPIKLCDDALDLFLRGSFQKFTKIIDSLEQIKISNVRDILNQHDNQMIQTGQDNFNEKFRNQMSGGDFLGDEEEEKSDVEIDNPVSHLSAHMQYKNFQSQLSSGNMDNEMHREMLIQKRNLLMKIRQNDNEYKKFDFKNEGNDGELIQKKMRKGQEEKYEKREEKRQNKYAQKQQRILNKCSQCYFQEGKFERQTLISESDNVYVSTPIRTSPVYPQGQDHISHVIISPKQHFVNYLEVDEQVQDEYRNYQKSIAQYFLEQFKMTTVFIETSIQSEHNLPHAQIDCIGIPSDVEMEFDLEVYFKKSLMDDDSEWGSHKKIIDTKQSQGKIWKCLPSSGVFNYVHIDFGGQGGFAHIIDDARKYNHLKALEVVAGAIGHDLVNLSIPLRLDKAQQYARDIKNKFSKFDWTKERR
ncbi:UNKNOWN [Stylonychia lemnae]|uniref:Cwf19-like C-terminal domain-containing protein n=1 Tax=Stylonychia lemnae TaxID=5949 RepID=A0A077ZSR6_STYLE|nr:UNKNOWN [Stylonychia lemnae]|eukprot:CDW72355.1 UNKNOWN [Stylonychia lemnae]